MMVGNANGSIGTALVRDISLLKNVRIQRQARLEAEVLLQKYRDRFGDISEQIAEQAKLISQQERQEEEKLAAYLRSLGINLDENGSST